MFDVLLSWQIVLLTEFVVPEKKRACRLVDARIEPGSRQIFRRPADTEVSNACVDPVRQVETNGAQQYNNHLYDNDSYDNIQAELETEGAGELPSTQHLNWSHLQPKLSTPVSEKFYSHIYMVSR